MDDVELDWGDDDQPVEHVEAALLSAKAIDQDEQDDVVSLDGDDDDIQVYLAQQRPPPAQNSTKHRPSPPSARKPPSARPSANSISALSKSPPAGLPPKPIVCDPIEPPFISSSDPALTSASAMAPPPKSTSNGLPPDWETRRSRDGEVYYYNIVTHESTWSKPTVPSTSPKAVKPSHSTRPTLTAPLSASLPPRPMTYHPDNERRPPSRERDRGKEHYRDKLSNNDKGAGRRPVSPRPTRGVDSYRPDYPSPPERSRRPSSPPASKYHGRDRDRDADHDSSNHHGRDRALTSLPSPPTRSRRVSSPPPSIVGSSAYRHTSPPPLSRRTPRRSRSPAPNDAPHRQKRTVSPPPFEDRPPRHDGDRSGLTRGRRGNNDRTDSHSPPPLVPQKRHETEPVKDYPEHRGSYPLRTNPSDQTEPGSKRRRTNDIDSNQDKRPLGLDRARNTSRSTEDVSMEEDRIRPRGPPLPSQDDRFRMSRNAPSATFPAQSQTGVTRPAIAVSTNPLPPSGPRSSRPVSSEVRPSVTPVSSSSINPPSAPRQQQRDASHPDFASHSRPPPAGPAAGASRRYGPRVSVANSTPLGGNPGISDGNAEDIPKGPRAMAQGKPRDERNGGHSTRRERSPRSRVLHEPRDNRERNRDSEIPTRRNGPDGRGRSYGPTSGTNAAPIGETKMRVWGQPVPNSDSTAFSEPRRSEVMDGQPRLRELGPPISSRDSGPHWRQPSPSPPLEQDITSHDRSPVGASYRERYHDGYEPPRRDQDRLSSRHEMSSNRDEGLPLSRSPGLDQLLPSRRRSSYSPPPLASRVPVRDYSPPPPAMGRRERRDSRMDDIIPNARKLSINDEDGLDHINGHGMMVENPHFRHEYYLEDRQRQPPLPQVKYSYPDDPNTAPRDWSPPLHEERALPDRRPRSPDPYFASYVPPPRDEQAIPLMARGYRVSASEHSVGRRSSDPSDSYDQTERLRRPETSSATSQAHYVHADFRSRSSVPGQSPPPAFLHSERRYSFTSQGPLNSLADAEEPPVVRMEYPAQMAHTVTGIAGLPPRPVGPLPPLSAGRSLLDRIEPSRLASLGGEWRADVHGDSSSSKSSATVPTRTSGSTGPSHHTSLRERLQNSSNNALYKEGNIPDEESRRRKRRRGGKVQ